MKLENSWRLALRALRKNKLQTALTMTGMTIGVATVLTMIALGSGAQTAIQDQVRSAGMNLIVVKAGNWNVKLDLGTADGVEGPSASAASVEPLLPEPTPEKPGLTTAVWSLDRRVRFAPVQSEAGVSADPSVQVDGGVSGPARLMPRKGDVAAGLGASTALQLQDAEAIRKLPGVQFVSSGIDDHAAVAARDNSVFTSLHGDDTTQPQIRRAWTFPHGRFFTKREESNTDHVVALGQIVSDRIFGSGVDPVGRDVSIKGTTFKVVGEIDSGSWMVRPAAGDDQFDAVYIPVTTMQSLMQRNYLSTITVTTESTGDVTRVSKSVTALLRQRHNIGTSDPDDFTVSSEARKALMNGGMRPEIAHAVVGNVSGFEKVTLGQLGKTLDRASSTMTALLTSIATVSLVVGGIGIMNVMLLSVSQRTHEIGIRRAVGARAQDVLTQFLLEAITLSLAGGAAGILIGCIASGSLSQLVQWSTRISVPAILVSFLVSAATGVFFGYYPARQASQVLPIESLKYE